MKFPIPQALENGSGRRDRITIFADILETAKDGAKKTQIMYGANLSFQQVEKYLFFMHAIQLIKINAERREKIYVPTQKGKIFLQKYSSINELLEFPPKNDIEQEERDKMHLLDKYF